MKTIGLLGGMSWESSIEYERIINTEVRRRLGGVHSADLIIRSYNFAEIEALPSVQAAEASVSVLEYNVPSYTGLEYPTRKYYPTWQTPADAPGTRAAVAAHRNAFEEDAEVGFWVFSTNAVATAGMSGFPTIGFGPGHEKFAHAPNEQVEVEHLVRASAFYVALVDEFAKTPNQEAAA